MCGAGAQGLLWALLEWVVAAGWGKAPCQGLLLHARGCCPWGLLCMGAGASCQGLQLPQGCCWLLLAGYMSRNPPKTAGGVFLKAFPSSICRLYRGTPHQAWRCASPLCRGCAGGPASLTPSPKLTPAQIKNLSGQATVSNVMQGGWWVAPAAPPTSPTSSWPRYKKRSRRVQCGRRDTPAFPRHPANASEHPTALQPKVRGSSS